MYTLIINWATQISARHKERDIDVGIVRGDETSLSPRSQAWTQGRQYCKCIVDRRDQSEFKSMTVCGDREVNGNRINNPNTQLWLPHLAFTAEYFRQRNPNWATQVWSNGSRWFDFVREFNLWSWTKPCDHRPLRRLASTEAACLEKSFVWLGIGL